LPPSTTRPIDRTLARLREHQAIVAIIERDAIAAVSTDISEALRLAWFASEMRAEFARGSIR
ncbi:MAG: hypothetical protein JO122_16315, partial [Acetobacteraceae bacterium]|nr:hypothetical protein [Acetobacteraceae bacterium]